VLFNSLTFVAFLTLVVGGYWLCPRAWRRGYLLAASYAFYCTWSVPFALLLLGTTAVAFVIAKRIAAAPDEAAQRRYLTIAVVLLLLPLAGFKYLSSFDAVLVGLFGRTTLTTYLGDIRFLGAVGISYYTLKLISYVVEVYWWRLPVCSSMLTLATYAAFFPQILSGPIQRAPSLIGQLDNLEAARADLMVSGFRLMLFGFFKKLVVADRLGMFVDPVFSHPQAFAGTTLVLSSYLFAIQLYADFSGITDIAIGTARLFGITSPPNFDAPFYAENIQDFWRRWHMTLTNWLGDYLFTPLRMALRGWAQWGLILSLAINMLAIGVWHGPRLTYVAFGALHAGYLIGSTLTLRSRKKLWQRHALLRWAHRGLGPLVTFHMVAASFVVFRAQSVADAWYILTRACAGVAHITLHFGHAGARAALAGAQHLNWSAGDVAVLVGAAVLMEIIHLLQRRRLLTHLVVTMPGWVRWAGYFALGFAVLIWGESQSKQFIYVRF
jgi:alginate O-acetyltransferase complex protein AlgI